MPILRVSSHRHGPALWRNIEIGDSLITTRVAAEGRQWSRRLLRLPIRLRGERFRLLLHGLLFERSMLIRRHARIGSVTLWRTAWRVVRLLASVLHRLLLPRLVQRHGLMHRSLMYRSLMHRTLRHGLRQGLRR